MAYLEVETQDGARHIPLDRDRLSIGRLPYNDIVLSSAQISRQHAEMRLIDGQWWIADLHSTNGLMLGSQRVQEHALEHGDRIMLAPNISVRFIDEDMPGAKAKPKAATPDVPGESGPGWTWGQRGDEPLHPTAAPSPPMPTPRPQAQPTPRPQVQPTQPFKPPQPPAQPPAQPFVPPSSVSPLKPRSIFSDDEVPYVPPGMAAQPPAPSSSFPGMPGAGAMDGAGNGHGGFPGSTSSPGNPAWGAEPPLRMPPYDTGGSGGYPAPQRPLQTGVEPHDFYRRSGSNIGGSSEQRQPTAGPASTLLHVCQTCGQLTAPDSVYCQNCHHSIAYECPTCRLSLLPIQERCPRCHTPNAASVRRAHLGRSAM